jgi:hypothetical protein
MDCADKNVPPRSWQEITQEASHETNLNRIAELAEELNRALQERDEKLNGEKSA